MRSVPDLIPLLHTIKEFFLLVYTQRGDYLFPLLNQCWGTKPIITFHGDSSQIPQQPHLISIKYLAVEVMLLIKSEDRVWNPNSVTY